MADTAILPDWAAHYVQENIVPHMHVVNVLPVDKGHLKGAFLLNTSKGAVLIQKGGLSEVSHWLIPLPGDHVTFSCNQCQERMDLVDPEVPRVVFCSNCGHEHYLVVQDGELAVIDAAEGKRQVAASSKPASAPPKQEAPPTPSAASGDITEGYTLYRRGRGGQATYFFAKSKPRTGKPAKLPKGATVEANPRTGVPEVRLPEMISTPGNQAYYAYRGDVHPVEDVEGIGGTYGERLRQAGVETTARLLFEDAKALSQRIDAPEKGVRRWQSQAELMLVKGIGPQYAEALARSGVEGVADLKKANAAELAKQINAYLDTLDKNVLGSTITSRRVQGWQTAAKTMRKVRCKVPTR